jgi:hypothetical protein
MVAKQKLEKALEHLRTWCEAMLANPSAPTPSPRTGLWFGAEDEGTLVLSEEDTEEYGACLDALVEAVADTEQASPKAIEQVLQTALLTVFDIRKKRTPDPRVRIEEAIGELRQFLSGKTQCFRIVVPVNGLDIDGLPITVGKVTFAVFDESQRDVYRQTVVGQPAEQRQEALKLIDEELGKNELRDRTVAITDVKALDWGAARSLAHREVRLTVNVVNFFSDLIRYHNGAHLRLPGDGPTERFATAQLKGSDGRWGQYAFESHWVGGMGKVSLPKILKQDGAASMGFERASQLIAASKRNDLEDRLIASLQWAGRATVARQNEEAFLLYTIALESLVLAGKDTNQELSYRLRLRVAHLLGSTMEQRRNVFTKMGELYGIRSAIVHDGHYQVTDADLSLMRGFTKTCLIRALTWKELVELTSRDALRDWFTGKLLG